MISGSKILLQMFAGFMNSILPPDILNRQCSQGLPADPKCLLYIIEHST
jgi:hypothetical protein